MSSPIPSTIVRRADGGLGGSTRNSPRGLRQFDLAVHEWIGLIAYRVSGRIDELFPSP